MPASSRRDGLQAAFAGIDVGGTAIKIGIVDERQNVVGHQRVRTADYPTPAAAVEQVHRLVEQSLNTLGGLSLQAVGLASPGLMADHCLQETSNLGGWEGVRLRELIERTFGRPVAVVNDAVAAAVAEHHVRRIPSLCLITLGTGVGCGLIIDDRPFTGHSGFGGELGHVVVDARPDARLCPCGRPGHLEAYAGAGGVVQTAQERLQGAASRLATLPVHELTPEILFHAAEGGDAVALDVVAATAEKLAIAIAGVAHVLGPLTFLLGGAMTFGGARSAVGRGFMRSIRQQVERLSLREIHRHLSIDFSSLGNDAGVIGAALIARRSALGPDSLRTSP
ncbi:MAG: ROK family protein [Planctomycetaceae bacterium]|nr:ROK family protein [Planctomycetaceae bacterium]